MISMGHTDIKMTMKDIHPLREGKRRVIGKLETASKRARPALAQAVGEEDGWKPGTPSAEARGW